jgi:hypothetical protein
MPVVSNYLNVGNFYSSYGSVSRFHRAAVFNRPLSAADALALSQNGLDDMDRWGTTKPSKTYDFATETLGSNDASNITVTNAQTVNGSPGWVTATRINSTGRIDLNATLSGTGALRKFYAVKHQTWTTGGTPSHFGASVGGNVTDSSLKSAVPAATETTVLSFTGSSAVTAIPTAVRVEPGTSTATTPAVSFPAGTAYSLKALRVFQVGAIVHLDLGIGCGNVIPDLSGRYHGNLVGSNWSHYISTCPAEVTQGPGTVAFGLRRFTQTISAKDGDTVTVTHNLGTMNLTVGVWSATGQWVHTAIQRKVGSETNAIEVGFALVGAPTTPIPFLVVVIG